MRERAVLVLAATLLVGCGGGEAATPPAGSQASPPAVTASRPTTPSPSATSAPAGTQPAGGTVIKTAGSRFGEMLFDGNGQAIYLFDREQTAKPECYDACAEAWPPVLTKAPPVAAGRADPTALGVTRRTDGTTQVTYAGHPLYFYAHEGRNQVLCHNVREFGGLWLVVTPSGRAAPH
jgi:predicted lipoprotein with Yx(FWY)xxD motif